MEPVVRREIIKNILLSWRIEPDKRLPKGTLPKLINRLSLPRYIINNDITKIKKDIKKQKNIEKTIHFQRYCHRNGLTRQLANKEVIVCKVINNALLDRLPRGGAALYIGTPTPFCSSKDQYNNKLLLTDNLEVAIILKVTTSEALPRIVIGNKVSPSKAEMKYRHWKANNSTCNFDILVDRVERDTYFEYVKELAEQYNIAKVVLMTSGIWSFCKQTQEKYPGCDFNFEEPSIELTNLYPNLHILAMIKNNKFQFGVRYLHRSINAQIY